MHHIEVQKVDGTIEAFRPQKLMISLMKAGASEDQAQRVLEKIWNEIDGKSLPTNELYRVAFKHLHEITHPAVAIRYSMRRALSELGPDGFAFEKFYAEILKSQGYETLLDQTVYGRCVPHEVDIVAWKGRQELQMVEAKFHHEYGFKTDLKIILYVKERYDDLGAQLFKFGGNERKLTSGWIVTNTKFTDTAIHYGECNGMKMVGWNYPRDGGLHKLIEESGVKPITSVPSISKDIMHELLKNGIVTCNDIHRVEGVLKTLGVDKARIAQVHKDIEQIFKLDLSVTE